MTNANFLNTPLTSICGCHVAEEMGLTGRTQKARIDSEECLNIITEYRPVEHNANRISAEIN